jgi:hypothetical protein
MRNVFVGTVLGVLVAACAQDGQGEQQDLSSAEGQQQEQDGGSGDNGGGEDAPVPALEPLIYIETISCDRTVARYEVRSVAVGAQFRVQVDIRRWLYIERVRRRA